MVCRIASDRAGVTREEGGFFARLAAGLTDSGVQVLRFDLRAHGRAVGDASFETLQSG